MATREDLRIKKTKSALFNAFFNMHYVYFCAMLCYPILVLGIKHYCVVSGTATDRNGQCKSKENEETVVPTKGNGAVLRANYQRPF